jgi:hypothetical protein
MYTSTYALSLYYFFPGITAKLFRFFSDPGQTACVYIKSRIAGPEGFAGEQNLAFLLINGKFNWINMPISYSKLNVGALKEQLCHRTN